jgi:hypothetical protein
MTHPGGAPTKYRPEYHNDKARKLALLGMTDIEIADIFDICEATINNWKNKYPEFLESLNKGKTDADGEIANALYHRAKGYTHLEDKLFCHNGEIINETILKQYPPDTAAALIWLKNRKPKLWRDKQDIDHTSGGEKVKSIAVHNFVRTSEKDVLGE